MSFEDNAGPDMDDAMAQHEEVVRFLREAVQVRKCPVVQVGLGRGKLSAKVQVLLHVFYLHIGSSDGVKRFVNGHLLWCTVIRFAK